MNLSRDVVLAAAAGALVMHVYMKKQTTCVDASKALAAADAKLVAVQQSLSDCTANAASCSQANAVCSRNLNDRDATVETGKAMLEQNASGLRALRVELDSARAQISECRAATAQAAAAQGQTQKAITTYFEKLIDGARTFAVTKSVDPSFGFDAEMKLLNRIFKDAGKSIMDLADEQTLARMRDAERQIGVARMPVKERDQWVNTPGTVGIVTPLEPIRVEQKMGVAQAVAPVAAPDIRAGLSSTTGLPSATDLAAMFDSMGGAMSTQNKTPSAPTIAEQLKASLSSAFG